MALQTLNIDDRNYDQLLEELKQHIPVSKWTDHHPSDPGIMLLELFAWLGEMTLYRMNRVPEAHQEKFLKLIIDPPEPVTVDVDLEYELSGARAEKLIIPAGTRFATDFKKGERYIFETIKETIIPAPTDENVEFENNDENEKKKKSITVNTRNWKKVIEEEVGISSNKPNQVFPLKHRPVLLDFVYSSAKYNPNPVVHVDGEEWGLKQFLMTEGSQAPDAKHVMVDEFDNVIRFGDGTFGAIPAENAPITCTYQVIQGPEALIKAGELKHILDDIPGLAPGESITISGNKDAQGGMYFLKKEEQLAKGLENYKKPYRLITSEDFEYALLTDFNQLQQLTRQNDFNQLPGIVRQYDIIKLRELEKENKIKELLQRYGVDKFADLEEKYFTELQSFPSLYKICRAQALMNLKYSGTPTSQLEEKPGHVTILVIPEFNQKDLAEKAYIEVPPDLEDKILRFLENRRLITTRLHIMPAKLKKINLNIEAVIFKDRSTDEMEETIRKQVSDFMDILQGGIDRKGWPIGRNLYKSHLYRLIESIEGMDYVRSLTFGTPGEENCLEIGDNELPLLQQLNISLERE
jgi:hypothetical protein